MNSRASIEITRDNIIIKGEGITTKVLQKSAVGEITVKNEGFAPTDLLSIPVDEHVISRVTLHGRITGAWKFKQNGGKKRLLVFMTQDT